MVIKTTICSSKSVLRKDHHLGNIDWPANLGWHGNLYLYDTLGRHGNYDHRVVEVDMVFYVSPKDRSFSR